MKHFRCGLPTDPASAAVIRHMRENGLLCADHRLRRGDREIAALKQREITLLQHAGVDVEVIAGESSRRRRSRCRRRDQRRIRLELCQFSSHRCRPRQSEHLVSGADHVDGFARDDDRLRRIGGRPCRSIPGSIVADHHYAGHFLQTRPAHRRRPACTGVGAAARRDRVRFAAAAQLRPASADPDVIAINTLVETRHPDRGRRQSGRHRLLAP